MPNILDQWLSNCYFLLFDLLINDWTILFPTASLHLPINTRPRDKAAKALCYNGTVSLTTDSSKSSWISSLDLPAYAIPNPKIAQFLTTLALFLTGSSKRANVISFSSFVPAAHNPIPKQAPAATKSP